jgi:hypothetical protein
MMAMTKFNNEISTNNVPILICCWSCFVTVVNVANFSLLMCVCVWVHPRKRILMTSQVISVLLMGFSNLKSGLEMIKVVD